MNIRYPIYEGVYRILTDKGAKTGTLSYPSTEINLPFKNKGSQMEL